MTRIYQGQHVKQVLSYGNSFFMEDTILRDPTEYDMGLIQTLFQCFQILNASMISSLEMEKKDDSVFLTALRIYFWFFQGTPLHNIPLKNQTVLPNHYLLRIYQSHIFLCLQFFVPNFLPE